MSKERLSWGVFAVVLVFAVVIVVARARKVVPPPPEAPVLAVQSARVDPPAEKPPEPDAGQTDAAQIHRFDRLPDGGAVPDLPKSAPKSVGFGVILFSYEGAQQAPNAAISRDEALKRAARTLEEARKNFAEAAKKGDAGSTADAGRMPRGVLEPAVEYLLFTLEKGEVYAAPLDTPRGFWIIKRLD